jgi:hypothetical protein
MTHYYPDVITPREIFGSTPINVSYNSVTVYFSKYNTLPVQQRDVLKIKTDEGTPQEITMVNKDIFNTGLEFYENRDGLFLCSVVLNGIEAATILITTATEPNVWGLTIYIPISRVILGEDRVDP